MALRFLVMPMRFIMSFSMAGMRIERSLRSFFLLAIVFCVERGVSRVTCGAHRQGSRRTFECKPVGTEGTGTPVDCRRRGRPLVATALRGGISLDDMMYADDDDESKEGYG